MERVRPGVDLWRASLEDFLRWLEQERQLNRTEGCLAKYLSHVRGLLEYAWRSGRAERNVLDGFSLQHTQRRTAPKFLNLQEAEQLVLATAAPGPNARRDRLVVLLLYGCGLRTSELCALDVADINRERHELVVQKEQGGSTALDPGPGSALYTELLAYLLEHGKRGALFRTNVRARRLARPRMSARSSPPPRAARVCVPGSPPARCATVTCWAICVQAETSENGP
jgi:integrase